MRKPDSPALLLESTVRVNYYPSMKDDKNYREFFYLRLTLSEEIALNALSRVERERRLLAWIQAQNILWILQERKGR